jgi:hypothetical protein
VSPGYRWTLDEYVLRCEHLVGLQEVVVEGELDRDLIADALARWGSDGVSILDADYLAIHQDEIDAAGFTAGIKGGLLTLAAALDASDNAEEVAARIAVVVDRDYDDQLTARGALLVTDGYSIENFALSVAGLNRFATQTLGRTPLPAGRDGTAPERRVTCSGEDLYARLIDALAAVSGLRLVLRDLDPPVGLFGSWLDYFKISPNGHIESNAAALLRNVLERNKRLDEIRVLEKRASEEATAATADPLRLVCGRDFVELLAKLLRSSWGRRRGGDALGQEISRLGRLLVFSVDSVVIDSTELMGGLRQRFA